MDNADIARTLDEIADLLEIGGGNVFRIRAYRAAARTVESLAEPVVKIIARDAKALTELPGIGKDLAGKIAEIARTGDLALRRELAKKIPPSITRSILPPSVWGTTPAPTASLRWRGPSRTEENHIGQDQRDARMMPTISRHGRKHDLQGDARIVSTHARAFADCEGRAATSHVGTECARGSRPQHGGQSWRSKFERMVSTRPRYPHANDSLQSG